MTRVEAELAGPANAGKLLVAKALLLEKRQCVEEARKLLADASRLPDAGQWGAVASRRLRNLGGKAGM